MDRRIVRQLIVTFIEKPRTSRDVLLLMGSMLVSGRPRSAQSVVHVSIYVRDATSLRAAEAERRREAAHRAAARRPRHVDGSLVLLAARIARGRVG